MMEFPKLLPCPFCGGKAEWCCTIPHVDLEEHDCDQIVCPQCEASLDVHSDPVSWACNLESARIEVAKVWNKRV